MDSLQKGVVTWSDFALFYSCKLIVVKDKVNHFLKYFHFFKTLFFQGGINNEVNSKRISRGKTSVF
jgi:hypothetical protein